MGLETNLTRSLRVPLYVYSTLARAAHVSFCEPANAKPSCYFLLLGSVLCSFRVLQHNFAVLRMSLVSNGHKVIDIDPSKELVSLKWSSVCM